MSLNEARARLYQSLAEAISEPPAWFCSAGDQWPLFMDAVELARHMNDPALFQMVAEIAEIPAESLAERRKRYHVMPPSQFYESRWHDGRLLGPTCFDIWQTYAAAGLAVADSELPDHASLELAFLAYLINQEIQNASQSREWRRARKLFVKTHAVQWLPSLGEAMAKTGDSVYGPIGRLLAYSVRAERRKVKQVTAAVCGLPVIGEPESCSLCGFCVQSCPTRALSIHEDEHETDLILNEAACIGCNRCVKTCPTQALELETAYTGKTLRVLRDSPRAHCPMCGTATVSQAEQEAVIAQIGNLEWLKYCLNCRPLVLERSS